MSNQTVSKTIAASIIAVKGEWMVTLYPVYTIEQTSSKHQAGLMEPRPLAQMEA